MVEQDRTAVRLFLARATCIWGAGLGAALVIRYLFDTLMPPADYTMRAAALSYIIIGACTTSGLSTAWLTHSIVGGLVTSLGAAAIGSFISIVGSAVMLAVWHDPATLDAWRSSGGLQEAFVDVPLKVMAIGAVLGLAGAVIGKGISTGLPGLENGVK